MAPATVSVNAEKLRVVRWSAVDGKYREDEEPVWIGTDPLDLSAQFPRRPWHHISGERDVLSVQVDRTSAETHAYFYEVMRDGIWQPCSDPRIPDCCVPAEKLKEHNPDWVRSECRHAA